MEEQMPREESQLASVVKTFNSKTEKLEALAETLEVRLIPILRPEIKTGSERPDPSTEELVPLVAELQKSDNRITAVLNKLENIIERIEV